MIQELLRPGPSTIWAKTEIENRKKRLKEKRAIRVRQSTNLIDQMLTKGFAYTDSLKELGDVLGYLSDNQIPYEYIGGGNNWRFAIRRTDRMTGV